MHVELYSYDLLFHFRRSILTCFSTLSYDVVHSLLLIAKLLQSCARKYYRDGSSQTVDMYFGIMLDLIMSIMAARWDLKDTHVRWPRASLRWNRQSETLGIHDIIKAWRGPKNCIIEAENKGGKNK